MTEQSKDQLIEIIDPDVDPAEIMLDIRKRIQEKRKEKKYDEKSLPKFGATAMPDQIDELEIPEELYRYLQQANDSFPLVDTTMMLADSPATRVPIVGPLWKMIRAGAHQLVLFYVNRNAAHQLSVNRNIVSVLNNITIMLQEQQNTISELRTEIETLRRQ